MSTNIIDKNVDCYRNAMLEVAKNDIIREQVVVNENFAFKKLGVVSGQIQMIFEGNETHKQEVLMSFASSTPRHLIERIVELIKDESVTLINE